MAALLDLEAAYAALRDDPAFWAELRELGHRYVGRPTPVYRADRLARALEAQAGRDPGRLRLYLKREDLDHTGAHKINNALGQALLTRRLGKQRVIAETGAGQHGVATATACALLDLDCVVYMGAEDIRRQAPNVLRMRALGTEVREVTSGTRDPQGRDQRGDARLGHERRHDPLRPRLGGRPAPLPGARPRPPAGHRGRGRAAGPGRRGTAARRRDRLRRRRLERDRADGPVRRGAGDAARGRRGGGGGTRRQARGGARRRLARRPPRLALVPAPGRRRPGHRGPLDLGRASTTRASGRSSPRCTPPGGSRSSARPTTRRSTGSGSSRGPRASCRRSSLPTRSPRSAPGSRARPASRRWPTTRSCCSACRAGETRTSPRSPTGCRRHDGRRERRAGHASPAPTGSAQPSTRPRGRVARRSSRMRSRAIRTRRPPRRSRSRRSTPARTCSRSACHTPIRSPTARRSSERAASRSTRGATLDRSIELVARIHAARPGRPLVTMGYVNQVLGGRDGVVGPRAARRRGRLGVHPRRPDAGRRRRPRARGGRARHRDRLPRRADDASRSPRSRRCAEPGLPLRGLARGRDGRAHAACRRASGGSCAMSGRSAPCRSRSGSVSRAPPMPASSPDPPTGSSSRAHSSTHSAPTDATSPAWPSSSAPWRPPPHADFGPPRFAAAARCRVP